MSERQKYIECLAKDKTGCFLSEGFQINEGECTEGIHEVRIQPNIICVNVPCSAKHFIEEPDKTEEQ